MTPELVGLFAQVPLVGIFVWFTLSLLKHSSEERVVRDKEWRDFLSARDTEHLRALVDLTGEIKCLSDGFKGSFTSLQSSVQDHNSQTSVHMAMVEKGLESVTANQPKRPAKVSS